MAAGTDDNSNSNKKKKKRKKRVTKTGIQAADRKSSASKAKKSKPKSAKAKKAKTKKASAKKKSAARGRKATDPLPTRALVLTNKDGEVSGVLPRHALVLVRRGIVVDRGLPAGVDPRPTQKAFMWLTGSRYGQGLDPSEPHQRAALRLVEFLVRASVLSKPEDIEIIEELYEVLHESGARPRTDHPEAAPLSTSDWGMTHPPGSDDSYE